MGPERLEGPVWALVEEGRDRVLRALDVVPVVSLVRERPGMVTFQIADRLSVLYTPCHLHDADLTAVALLDGRPVQLGHVQDADDLAAAIIGHPLLDSLDADRLLADLARARVGP
jgi:hypothetical protein